ncbi:MAG: 30S ribosomal protein S4 [Planctomycetota bacterium]|jgi:small subunit ribosomal protein S4|nr:30S ribosomal protein S4 [Planctomycetota bacterium]MDA1200281.1 30S ribosomal protein S4 [Planctomycetota bacterium]
MGRITGPVCRLCRRDGLKLFLKGSRCDTPKCAFERRSTPPGVVQKRRPKTTDYGLRLREKQKVKHYYGVLERQFRTYFDRAARGRGNTGEALMALLERRLDNVVHRLGFAASRAAARQMVMHGHITVNGRRVDIPSYLVKAGDLVRVKNRAKSLQLVHAALAEFRREVPDFLSRIDGGIPEARVDRLPAADDVSIPVQANLIIELCSK